MLSALCLHCTPEGEDALHAERERVADAGGRVPDSDAGSGARLPESAPRCRRCGEVIGVYEPLIHVVGGLSHRTSRAACPRLSANASEALYHAACYEGAGSDLAT
jgi:hypothetical protein